MKLALAALTSLLTSAAFASDPGLLSVTCTIHETAPFAQTNVFTFEVLPGDSNGQSLDIPIPGTSDSYGYDVIAINSSGETQNAAPDELQLTLRYEQPFCNPPVLQPVGAPPAPLVCDRALDPAPVSSADAIAADPSLRLHIEGTHPLFHYSCDGAFTR